MTDTFESEDRGTLRIGLLVPYTNTNFEPDMARLKLAGATLHSARLGGYDVDEIPGAEQMAGLGAAPLDEPIRLVAGVRPHAVLYGCTSATLTHGRAFDRQLAEQIESACGAVTITAASALVGAIWAWRPTTRTRKPLCCPAPTCAPSRRSRHSKPSWANR